MSENRPGPFITAGRLLWQSADAVVRINMLWFALTVIVVTAPGARRTVPTCTSWRRKKTSTFDDFGKALLLADWRGGGRCSTWRRSSSR